MKRSFRNLPALVVVGAFALAGLTACGSTADIQQKYPSNDKRDQQQLNKLQGGDTTLFGDLTIGGDDNKNADQGSFASVNFFLWRAALETLSLGPLESADPFGGVIITDWFSLNGDPKNQYRVTAYILGRQLRTDNIRVALYIRSKKPDGTMETKRASKEAEIKLENVILSKARTIRATQYR